MRKGSVTLIDNALTIVLLDSKLKKRIIRILLPTLSFFKSLTFQNKCWDANNLACDEKIYYTKKKGYTHLLSQ